jgi:peptidyl-prolyl cis-trans isomerase C
VIPMGVLKLPSGKSWRIALALSLVLLACSGLASFLSRDTGLPEGSALRASGVTVSAERLDARVKVLSALYGVQKPESGSQLDKFNRDAAKSMAITLLMDKEAKRRGIVIADRAAETELTKFLEQSLSGDRAAFVNFLADKGISEGDVLTEIKRNLATRRLYDEVVKGTPVATEAEARATYDQKTSSFVTAEARHLRNIVVRTKEDGAAVLTRLQHGASFSEVALDESLDSATRKKGGDLGTVTAQELEQGFATVAFAAQENTYFGPVETQYGWNVGHVDSIVPGHQLAFDQVKEQLIASLSLKKKQDVWRKWLADVVKSADVEYAPSYLPENPDAVPTEVPE